ncbi:helix-turn-helix transcriptional regulator [Patulibacter medicamentivorans]|uniref:helix-turn-helix transcriptional regulator n=1 Tax=Patulibacter medicamentivorans TaxID=1097667 RepID=UPI00031E3B41|nr:LuxR C-terminal-related transcriptional regulator [Patulibacter medicamentivorans]
MTAVDEEVPRAFPAPSRSPGWRRRESELVTRVTTMHQAVSEALGEALAVSGVDRDRPGRSAEIVSALTWICIERLRLTAEADHETTARLCGLVAELQQLALELYEHELSLRTRRLVDCSAGLSRLRSLPTSADLIDQVCEELVRRCGFGRVVLSRVENGIWKPWMGYFSDEQEFESWFTDWVNQAIPLDEDTLEAQLLRERRPGIVYDTETATVHRPIIVDAGRSRSYVAAPVMPGGTVVGFLHADYHPSARRVDDVDRDVLWAFAEGFGQIYERSVLLERLRAQRDHVRETLASTERMMDELCDSGIDLAQHPDPGTIVTRSAVSALSSDADALSELTAREREVLELMVVGATNGAIAEQLVITEGTVKSHVKHILRKLGAVNRSQAIARYLGIAQIGQD